MYTGMRRFPKFDAAFPGLGRVLTSPVKLGAVYVYLLVDPIDQTVRYVGTTQNPFRREAQHRDPKKWSQTRTFDTWRADTPAFQFLVVDSGSLQQRAYLEQGWISYYRARGHLYNVLDGGAREYQRYLEKTQPGAKKAKRRRKQQPKDHPRVAIQKRLLRELNAAIDARRAAR